MEPLEVGKMRMRMKMVSSFLGMRMRKKEKSSCFQTGMGNNCSGTGMSGCFLVGMKMRNGYPEILMESDYPGTERKHSFLELKMKMKSWFVTGKDLGKYLGLGHHWKVGRMSCYSAGFLEALVAG